MASQWYINDQGNVRGPFSPAQFSELAQEGRLTSDMRVRKGADGAWVRAEDVQGLTLGPPPATPRDTDRSASRAVIPVGSDSDGASSAIRGPTQDTQPRPVDFASAVKRSDRSFRQGLYLAGGLAIAGIVIAIVVWLLRPPPPLPRANLIVVWPVAQRSGGQLLIDGVPQWKEGSGGQLFIDGDEEAVKRGELGFRLSLDTHTVKATRAGFKDVERELVYNTGRELWEWKPEWIVEPRRVGPSGPHEIAKSYQQAVDAVVKFRIITSDSDGDVKIGAGFFIWDSDNKRFWIVTNFHVVEDATTESRVECKDGTVCQVEGIVAAEKSCDLALVKVSNLPYKVTYLDVCTDEDIEQGQDAWAIGHPQNMDFFMTKGTIGRVVTTRDLLVEGHDEGVFLYVRDFPMDMLWIQHTVITKRGSSGGPLVDAVGRALGVNTLVRGDFGLSAMLRQLMARAAIADDSDLEKPKPR